MNRKSKTPTVRCAIYTRKSTEEGLEQEFNTLDAQRDAGEAYIKSQAAEGWTCVPEYYDDGGFSGGNMDRPALRRLMAEIEAGRIECVVVYKVDRLSRSLLDFARMMEVFERRGISFVSVTQQFNTGSSMGRLILNVLLSFAQFEREMISERTRDKIAAARRKGKWSGGMPLLGYDVVNRKLQVNPAQAAQVRETFLLYQQKRSLLAAVQELACRNWTTKSWTTHKGVIRGGRPFTKSALQQLLSNPTYLGKIRYKQELYEGEHEGIVDTQLFENVQEILRSGAHSRVHSSDDEHPPLLRGLLRCGPCNRAMIHSFTTRGTRRYRYYLCNNAQERGWATCPSPSAPAAELERFVIEQIQSLRSDLPASASLLLPSVESTDEDEVTQVEVSGALQRFDALWATQTPWEQAQLLPRLVRSINYHGKAGKLDIAFRQDGLRSLAAELDTGEPEA